MNWIREHFALLLLLGILSLILVGLLSVHFPAKADDCRPGSPNCGPIAARP